MKRICSWCNKEMEAGSGRYQVITHGICEACAVGVLTDIEAAEVHVPEGRPRMVLKSLDPQIKLLSWQRPGRSQIVCRQ